jgi:hypothetical protein
VPSRRAVARLLAALAGVGIVTGGIDVALAAFGSQTANGGNVVAAAPDFRAPVVTAAAVGKAVGGAPGYVRQGGGYYVYANVAADTGAPASGLATVRANVASLTGGATAVTLTAGSYTAGGVSYGYRSDAQTASAVVSEGAKSFTVTATDNAANANTRTGSATVDNTPPAAADVQAANGPTGTVSLVEEGDTMTLSFSEPVEPQSILAGWNGSATTVVVRLVDAALLGLGADAVQVYDAANTTQLPLGQVQLGRGDYLAVGLSGNARYGATGTPSTMTMTGNTVVLTLGTYGSVFLVDPARTTAAATGTMVWNPVATPYDRAQNPLSTAAATESGVLDRDF